jgi:hypothetical protein
MTSYELFGKDETKRWNNNCYTLGSVMFYIDDEELMALKDHVRAVAIAEIIEQAQQKRRKRK